MKKKTVKKIAHAFLAGRYTFRTEVESYLRYEPAGWVQVNVERYIMPYQVYRYLANNYIWAVHWADRFDVASVWEEEV